CVVTVSITLLFFCYWFISYFYLIFFFFQAEDGIRCRNVTGVQTCALPICIKLVETRISKLERLREHGALMESQVRTLIADKKELVKLRRIHRSEYDVLYLAWLTSRRTATPRSEERRVGKGRGWGERTGTSK